MGIAAILIILCHIRGVEYLGIPYLEKVLSLGNFGVEIFLFVSGIGMWYSFNCKRRGLREWYKRRFCRIVIPFVLITTAVYPLRFAFGVDASPVDFLLHITTLEYWLYHRGAWYVAMLFPLYLITPVLIKEMNGSAYKKLFIIVLSTAISVCCSFSASENAIVQNVQFVVARIPIYVIGIAIAPFVASSCKIRLSLCCGIIALCVCLCHFAHISLAGAITVVIVLGILVDKKPMNEQLNKILDFMGGISLESYLSNIYLGHIVVNSNALGRSAGGVIVVLFGLLIAVFFNKLSNIVTRRIL